MPIFHYCPVFKLKDGRIRHILSEYFEMYLNSFNLNVVIFLKRFLYLEVKPCTFEWHRIEGRPKITRCHYFPILDPVLRGRGLVLHPIKIKNGMMACPCDHVLW